MITVFVISIIIVELPEPNPPGFSELLNQIYLPTGIDDELKSATREEPLMVQFTIPGRFTVTTTICVFVQPLAVNVYTYVTFTGEPVVSVSVSEIAPVPLEAGLLIPATAARVQVNVVPVTLLVGV